MSLILFVVFAQNASLDEKLPSLALLLILEKKHSGEVFFSFFSLLVQPSRWLSSNLMITDIARGLIQFHSTPYWTEMRAIFFLLIPWTPRSSVIPVPPYFRCSYKGRVNVTQPPYILKPY